MERIDRMYLVCTAVERLWRTRRGVFCWSWSRGGDDDDAVGLVFSSLLGGRPCDESLIKVVLRGYTIGTPTETSIELDFFFHLGLESTVERGRTIR